MRIDTRHYLLNLIWLQYSILTQQYHLEVVFPFISNHQFVRSSIKVDNQDFFALLACFLQFFCYRFMARILAKSMFNRIRKPSRGEDFRQVAAFGASNPGRKLVRAVSEVGPMKIEDRHCQDGRTFFTGSMDHIAP